VDYPISGADPHDNVDLGHNRDILTIVSLTPIYTERDLARAIKTARRQRRWTQADLAARANVSPRVIEKLEQGAGKTVNMSTVFALLRALSLDLRVSTRKGSPTSLEADQEEEEEEGP